MSKLSEMVDSMNSTYQFNIHDDKGRKYYIKSFVCKSPLICVMTITDAASNKDVENVEESIHLTTSKVNLLYSGITVDCMSKNHSVRIIIDPITPEDEGNGVEDLTLQNIGALHIGSGTMKVKNAVAGDDLHVHEESEDHPTESEKFEYICNYELLIKSKSKDQKYEGPVSSAEFKKFGGEDIVKLTFGDNNEFMTTFYRKNLERVAKEENQGDSWSEVSDIHGKTFEISVFDFGSEYENFNKASKKSNIETSELSEEFKKFADDVTGECFTYKGSFPLTVKSVEFEKADSHAEGNTYVMTLDDDMFVKIAIHEDDAKKFVPKDGKELPCLFPAVRLVFFNPEESQEESEDSFKIRMIGLLESGNFDIEVDGKKSTLEDFIMDNTADDVVRPEEDDFLRVAQLKPGEEIEVGPLVIKRPGSSVDSDNDIPKNHKFFVPDGDTGKMKHEYEGACLSLRPAGGSEFAIFYKRAGERGYRQVPSTGYYDSIAEAIDELNHLGGKSYVKALLTGKSS